MAPKIYFGEENPHFDPESSGLLRDDPQKSGGLRSRTLEGHQKGFPGLLRAELWPLRLAF